MTLDLPTHLPPQSLEAEEAILGAMMMSATVIEVATELRLVAKHFYRPSHQTIFESIMQLAERDTVDELTVINDLKHRSLLGSVGGAVAVMTLAERVPSVANARAYAEEVIAQAKLRFLVDTGHNIAKLGYEHPDTPDNLLLQASAMIEAHGDADPSSADEWTTLDVELDELAAALKRRKEAGTSIVGLTTGLDALDTRWGGLQNARLYIGAGRPGMGKSAWLYGVMEHVALELGEHVALFNFEMNPAQQAARAAARLGAADLHRITNALPTDHDITHVASTQQRYQSRSPLMHINRSASMTIQQIQRSARRLNSKLRRSTGKGLAAVGVDYIQLIESSNRSGRDDRQADLTHISRGLKLLGKELDVPVVALSQLNRQVENRPVPRPVLSDLRESGAIEQDADVVLLLYRPEYYTADSTEPEWQGKAEAITAKWRDGTPGTDILGWDGPRTKFVHASKAPRATFYVGGAPNQRDIA